MQIRSYPGDKIATEILNRANCFFGLGELRALMAGTLLGLEFVQPSVVLDYIEFSEINQPGFGDQELAKDFLGVFFGLWNEVANHRDPNKPFSFSKPKSTWKNDDVANWCEFAELLGSEIGNFLVGLELSKTPTLVELIKRGDKNTDNYLPQILAKYLGDLEKERIKLQKKKTQDGRPIKIIIQGMENDLKKFHAPFLEKLSSNQSHPKEEANPTVRDKPKVGRNDLCPCGSGKKFKQCCLQ